MIFDPQSVQNLTNKSDHFGITVDNNKLDLNLSNRPSSMSYFSELILNKNNFWIWMTTCYLAHSHCYTVTLFTMEK